MKHCYAVCLQKGGTGKTTTALLLSDALARRGERVLAIDFEPQCNLTTNYKAQGSSITIYDLLAAGSAPESAVVTRENGPDIIPGSQQMYLLDTRNINALRDVVSALSSRYDYIVIDTPPSAGTLSMLALAAADRVILPASADRYGIEAVTQFYDGVFSSIKESFNKDLQISGVLLNKYKGNSVNKMGRQTLEIIASKIGTKVFDQTLRESVDIQKAQFICEPLADVAPRSKVLQDVENFVTELIETD